MIHVTDKMLGYYKGTFPAYQGPFSKGAHERYLKTNVLFKPSEEQKKQLTKIYRQRIKTIKAKTPSEKQKQATLRHMRACASGKLNQLMHSYYTEGDEERE